MAVLPVGSFEQHGSHLPLATDTLIACAIAERIATDHDLFLLPPVTIACSHEHTAFTGTVSIRASTLYAVLADVLESLSASGITRLAVVNGHGGNYVLSNVVQEANTRGRRAVLFPRVEDWTTAREHAGLVTGPHEDMHAGEGETSILLHAAPKVVRPAYRDADHIANERTHLLTLGIAEYSTSGVVGRPSLASETKGKLLLSALSGLFLDYLEQLDKP